MSSSESMASDMAEYPDYVHECLKYVSIYSNGAFSCSSADDEDDCSYDEDMKRIISEHNEPEPRDCDATGFSSPYQATEAVIAEETDSSLNTSNRYEDWDKALEDAVMVYPPLGVCRFASESSKNRKFRILGGDTDVQSDLTRSPSSSAQLLRKCLEGALYGQDTKEFAVAQPYCVANKNLDFGKSKMSPGAVHDSKKRVENWMSKYYIADIGPGTGSGH